MIDLWDDPDINAVDCQAEKFYDKHKADFYSLDGPGHNRLGHSQSLERPDHFCGNWNSKQDTVKCVYIFGESVIIQKHPFGKCPWKML